MIMKEIFIRAMRKIQQLETGEEPTAEESQDLLNTYNSLTAGVCIARNIPPSLNLIPFVITSGIYEYEIGPDLSVAPNHVITPVPFNVPSLQYSFGEQVYSVSKIDYTEFDTLSINLSTGLPAVFSYNKLDNSDVGVLRIYPKPGQTTAASFRALQPKNIVTSINSVFPWGRQYEDYFILELADSIASEFGTELMPRDMKRLDKLRKMLAWINIGTPGQATSDVPRSGLKSIW